MDATTVNILLTSFPGLGVPRTLSLNVHTTSSISDVVSCISDRIPDIKTRLLLTTTSNRLLSPSSSEPITTLLSSPSDTFLPLRLSAPLCGGKGGFGSQLRAAGGRMSSRKKKNQGDANGSSRNLDGRRLRTITEAKALAEYLALKPDMDKKEKEERRKRWQQVVELAEKQQDEVKNGNKFRLNEKWLEDKDEASEKTREAVIAALRAGEIKDVMVESDASESGSEQSGSSDNEAVKASAEKTKASTSKSSRTFFGWDEDEEMMSDSEEDEEDEVPVVEGKGKERA